MAKPDLSTEDGAEYDLNRHETAAPTIARISIQKFLVLFPGQVEKMLTRRPQISSGPGNDRPSARWRNLTQVDDDVIDHTCAVGVDATGNFECPPL